MGFLNIRTATFDDLDALLEFEAEVIREQRPFDETLKDDDVHFFDLNELLNSEECCLLVAENDGEIVGTGFAAIHESDVFLKFKRHAWIGFMYVKPEFRKKSVNTAILEELKQWIIEQKISEIRLEVYDANLPAKNAYLKANFEPHLLQMRLDVSEEL